MSRPDAGPDAGPGARPRRRLFADLTPLQVSPAYRRMWFGTSLSGIGAQLTNVAVGLQVYAITGSTFRVGLVGLFALVPLVVMGLYGGSLIDAYDRRKVIVTSSGGLLLMALAFTGQALLKLDNVWLLYGLVAVQSGFFAVNSPARTAIVPRLLDKELLPAANALGNLSMSLGLTVGPVAAGLLVAWGGFPGAYSIEAIMLVIALSTLIALPPLPPEGEVRRSGFRSVLEGLAFLRTRPNVRMTFLVDIAAMVLAMPRVLFPAIAATVIGGGATTVGLLTGGIAVGSILAGVLSGPLGQVRRQGRAVIGSVLVWGAAIAGFGLVLLLVPARGGSGGAITGGSISWVIVPALVLLAVAGAADAVSGVFRTTILQSATPDGMRGRLQGVFIVVVAGGPRLGDLIVGSAGDVGSERFAAVAGGLACIAAVLALAAWQPGFARYDARNPTP